MHKRRIRAAILFSVSILAGMMVTACETTEHPTEAKEKKLSTVAEESAEPVDTIETTQSVQSEGKYKIKTCGIIKSVEDVYNLTKQKQVYKKLQSWKKASHTFDNPLLVMNPYGTNTTGLYVYFTTDEKVSVSYKIKSSGTSAFEKAVPGSGKKHEFSLIGLIAGKKNNVEITIRNAQGEIVKTGSFSVKPSKLLAAKPPKITVTEGESTQSLEDGLFAFMGHDKSVESDIYLSDNEGNIRGEIPLLQYRADQLLFLDNGMYFSYSYYDFAVMNPLGQIIKTYSIGDYKMHHDYIYDKKNKALLVLVNKKGSDTIEDVVISLNLKTGKVKELMDFSVMLKKMVSKCVAPEGGNTYGGDELDWMHLNSLDIIHGTDLIVSSRELNSLICVKNYRTKPEIDYIICDKSLWKGTPYSSLVLKKKGDFVAQAGQHTIQFLEDVDEDSYYLVMYNNNYTRSRTRPDWENSGFPAYKNTGKYKKDPEASYYYKYLVNTKKGTYELVDEIAVPYSSIVSSTEFVGNNLVTSSGNSKCFNEYDAEGKLIAQFDYTSKKYAYRVYKYSFEDFWFAKENE